MTRDIDQAHPVKPCNLYARGAAVRWCLRMLRDSRTLIERALADLRPNR